MYLAFGSSLVGLCFWVSLGTPFLMSELDDELEAINAIYPECLHELGDRIYRITVPEHSEVGVVLSFPLKYPEEACTIIQVVAKEYDESYLESKFNEILLNVWQGQVCVFELLMELQQFMDEYVKLRPPPPKQPVQPVKEKEKTKPVTEDTKSSVSNVSIDYTAGWTSLEPINDRQLTFIAYARECHSVDEAREYIDHLTQDKRIARAAHNITAWRIKADNGVQFQDCDDDGETAAGGRVLHLLTMMDRWNVVVCVLRWFGGIHLGPDRFKHINLAARDAVVRLEEEQLAKGSGRGEDRSSRRERR